MIRTAAIALAVILSCTAAGAADFQGRVKEGLYEITTSVEASGTEGMPEGLKMPDMTAQKCISRKDVEDAGQSLFFQQGPLAQLPKECKVQNFSITGDTASYKMVCNGSGKMAMDGMVTFTGSGYHGINSMTIAQAGGQLSMKMRFDSKYLGPCRP
jgi:hypothetical protein